METDYLNRREIKFWSGLTIKRQWETVEGLNKSISRSLHKEWQKKMQNDVVTNMRGLKVVDAQDRRLLLVGWYNQYYNPDDNRYLIWSCSNKILAQGWFWHIVSPFVGCEMRRVILFISVFYTKQNISLKNKNVCPSALTFIWLLSPSAI